MVADHIFKPKVSIIVPVYNGSNYLRESIDSALSQSYDNLEIIVVNDGSDDFGQTESIALSYGEKIRYIKKENGGVASALNIGIMNMSGQYFSWLSHDDIYDPVKVTKQVEFVSSLNDRNVVVYSDCGIFHTNRNDLVIHQAGDNSNKCIRYNLITHNSIHGCTLLIPKVCFETVGMFDESLRTTQDYDMWFRIANKFRFFYLPKCLVLARQHPEQDSKTKISVHNIEVDEMKAGFLNKIGYAEFSVSFDEAFRECIFISGIMVSNGYYNAAHAAIEKAQNSACYYSIRLRIICQIQIKLCVLKLRFNRNAKYLIKKFPKIRSVGINLREIIKLSL